MTIKTRKTGTKTPKVSFFGYIYNNSCGYCKDFELIWNELVPLLTEKNINHGSFQAGVVSDKDINKTSGAIIDTSKGVPNIFKVVNNKVYYYEGERTAAILMKWLDEKPHIAEGLFPGLPSMKFKGGKVRFNSRTKKGYSTLGFMNSLKKKYRKTPFFRR